jgi:zinc protease
MAEPSEPSAIHQTSIDGVTVLWSPEDGPLRASLSFGAGVTDEPLARRGICHVSEHLALFPIGRQRYSFEGFVDPLRTTFTVEGRPDEVVSFIDAVTANLHAVRVDRLADELRVMSNEQERRSGDIVSDLLWLRYGADGPGKVWYDELTAAISATDLAEWAAARYTTGNAIAWLTGEPPAELRFRLPAGDRRPSEPLRPIPGLPLPAWGARGYPGVAVGLILPRSAAARMGIRTMILRLEQRLRYELGHSYAVNLNYRGLDATTAHAALFASCSPPDVVSVRNAFAKVIAEFLDSGPTEEELDRDVDAFQRSLDARDAVSQRLDRTAMDLLFGRPLHDPATRLTRLREVTPEACREASSVAFDSAIMGGPFGNAPGPRWSPYPANSSRVVTGRRYRSSENLVPWRKADRLIVGDAGVSVVTRQGRATTVLFDECVLLLVSPGQRTLYGRDGFALTVRVRDWWNTGDVIRRIDAAVPPERWAPYPNLASTAG